MFGFAWLGLVIALQIPAPEPVVAAASSFRPGDERRTIIAREATDLESLARRLDHEKRPEVAKRVRNLIVTATNSDSLTHFVPLPEVVNPRNASSDKSAIDPGEKEAQSIRKRTGETLLSLARRSASAEPARSSVATECVRDVLAREPDHAEARRILGYEPYNGGWARPFAIRQLKLGNVLHSKFGWVPESSVAQFDAGLLPAPSKSRNPKAIQWLPAAEADRLRADGNPPWRITTEHFEIQSNVPLSETIAFGRKLEDFYDLFFTVMADAIGNSLPIARRLRETESRGTALYTPHLIYYFATKEQYLSHLRNIAPPDIDKSLGYYDPLARAKKNRRPAYFFRDEGGPIEAVATLYHEVSHQLLFESMNDHSHTRNVGNYWVFEGLGTFFETVRTRDDGSMEVGDFVGPRIEAALDHIALKGNAMPTALYVALRQDVFNREKLIYTNYQQAMALTVFLMRWHEGVYRPAFLDYVRDALKGRLRVDSGRTLQDALGIPYETIDAQFLDYFKKQSAARSTAPAVEPTAAAK